MPVNKCCRTCALWDIEAAKNKAGRCVRTAKCLWKSPPFPDAAKLLGHTTVVCASMSADDGKDCSCWIERK